MTNYNIIAIHGTFAAAPSNQGEQWWQIGSTFSTSLMSYFTNSQQNNIVWIPFRWSGKNSEQERRKAAKELQEMVTELIDNKNEDNKVYCIGHSHAGNIIRRAISKIKDTSKVKDKVRFISVGTPYFANQYDDTIRSLFAKLPIIISTFLIGSVLQLLLPFFLELLLQFFQINYPLNFSWFWTFSVSVIIILLVSYFGLSVFIKIISYRAIEQEKININNFEEQYPFKWFKWFLCEKRYNKIVDDFKNQVIIQSRSPKIYSKLDEAINALKQTPKQEIRIVSPQSIFIPTSILISIITLILLIAINSQLEIFQPYIQVTLSFLSNHIRTSHLNTYSIISNAFVKTYIRISTALIIYLLFSLLIAFLFSRIKIHYLVAFLLNLIFKEILINRAYGTYKGERIGSVSPNGSISKDLEWNPLPNEFDTEIEDFIGDNAQETLKIARKSLSMATTFQAYNLIDAIGSSLSFKEILHTSYFDLESFIKFIAWIFVEKFGFEKNHLYENQILTEKDKYKTWYTAISESLNVKI